MKKIKLFLAAMAAMVTMGVNAQSWTGNDVATGDFYLYNIGTGKWLSSGNSWGTQASLVEAGGFCSTLELSEGKYAIKNTETRTNNKAKGPGYLGTNGFMDGESAAYFTFTAATRSDGVKAYYIQNGSDNLSYSGTGTTVVFNAETGDNAQWVLVTKQDRLNAMAAADENNPVDATFLLKNAEFGRYKLPAYDAAWTFTFPGGTNKNNAGDNTNFCVESYHVAFDFAQVVADAPKGYYAVRGQAFYRQDGSNTTDLPYFYIGEARILFPAKTGDEGSMNAASTSFTAGSYMTSWSAKTTYAGGDLKVGTHLDNNTALWCIWDNIQIQYYGPIDLSQYVLALQAAVDAAEATQGTIPTGCYNAIAAIVAEKDKTYDNADAYSDAITAINNAVSTYASTAILNAYANYLAVRGAVLAIDSSIDLSSDDALVNAATEVAAVDAATVSLRGTLKTYLATTDKTNVDLTVALLINPGFETGTTNGWTNSGTQSAAAQGNKAFDNTQGNFYAERWHAAGTVDLNQSLSNMPSGVYEIGAFVYSDANEPKLYINDSQTSFSTSDWYTARVAVDADATLRFGASCTLTDNTWICMDGFKLTLVSAGLPDVAAVTGKMNADVAAAQTTAIEAYNANKTVANYNAASAAIAAAEASVAAYAKAATAIAAANALKDAHNFASTSATTTFAEAIAAVQAKYDNGTLTNDEANAGGSLGTVVTGWHGGNNNPAAVYLRDGFALGDFEADPALHVNTWSTEGDSDGTGFSVPFYESWTADANSLPESTLTGTLNNLPNGLYKVSAWVRVRAKNETAANDATGITMDVNGGTAVDVTEGTQVGTSQFNIGSYEAEGLVKQGNLTLNFNIANNANISWLSFQHVKYTKVRDLTPEEAFVAATADDYVALNTAIATAEAKTLGFDAGEYAPYNNIEATAALAAAKAIDQTIENAQEDVQAATTALNNVTWTENASEVNAVYDGTFAAATNDGAPAGWTMSNNTLGGSYHSRAFVGDDRLSEFNETKSGLFLRFDGTNSNRGSMYYYGNTKNYTMPLKAGVTYYAKVDIKGWGSTGKPQRINITGPEGFTALSQQFNLSNDADKDNEAPQQFLIVFKATVAGDYVINFQTPGSDDNKHNAMISNIELKRAQSVDLAVSSAKWATFVAPFDVTIPDGVTAYTVDGVTTGNALTMTPVSGTISANTPVVLNSDSDTGFAATAVYGYAKPVAAPTAGLLTGTYTEIDAPDGKYILQDQRNTGGKVGFYEVDYSYLTAEGLDKPKVKANRAYFTNPNGGGVKAFFLGDTEDAIKGVFDGVAAGEIYDLAGRKVQNMQKGNVYIVNGKKVIVK